jgi:CRP-like cAMP-binding protein
MNVRKSAATAFVAGNGWLASCKPDFRDWIINNLQWHRFAAGEGISHAGDEKGAMFCVGSGQVFFTAGVGVADIGTSYFGLPGIWWGHAPLMGGGRLGSVVAAADSICGAVPITALRARLKSHPEDWRAIALGIAELFTLSAGAHADQLIPESGRRVAATILRLGGHRHRMYPITPPASIVCTQEQLAGATALSRNTVGKVVRGFESDGLVDTSYGRIVVLDPARLERCAEL